MLSAIGYVGIQILLDLGIISIAMALIVSSVHGRRGQEESKELKPSTTLNIHYVDIRNNLHIRKDKGEGSNYVKYI